MRLSRETLKRATADLQAELEERIYEGAWARVRRYFSDQELRVKLSVAKIAKKATEVN